MYPFIIPAPSDNGVGATRIGGGEAGGSSCDEYFEEVLLQAQQAEGKCSESPSLALEAFELVFPTLTTPGLREAAALAAAEEEEQQQQQQAAGGTETKRRRRRRRRRKGKGGGECNIESALQQLENFKSVCKDFEGASMTSQEEQAEEYHRFHIGPSWWAEHVTGVTDVSFGSTSCGDPHTLPLPPADASQGTAAAAGAAS
jgi:hypothetical protein